MVVPDGFVVVAASVGVVFAEGTLFRPRYIPWKGFRRRLNLKRSRSDVVLASVVVKSIGASVATAVSMLVDIVRAGVDVVDAIYKSFGGLARCTFKIFLIALCP